MKTKLQDLIDFERVNILLEGFNKATGFVTAILDLEGNVLSKSGWRQICTEFHRVHPETSKKCTESDTALAGQLAEGGKYHYYKCLNGLVDVAVPIIVNGEHIGNLFTGQFFFDEPDKEFFRKQAAEYGFDEKTYLESLEKVPVVSESNVKPTLDFLLNMTQLISEMMLQRIEFMQMNDSLKKSEEELLQSKMLLESSIESPKDMIILSLDREYRYLYFNKTHAESMGHVYGSRPQIGECIFDFMTNKDDIEMVKAHYDKAMAGDGHSVLEEYGDGEVRFYYEIQYNPIYNEKKEIIGITSFAQNITERKQAEEDLRNSKDYLEKLNNSLGEAVFTVKMPDREIDFANQAVETIFGYKPDECIGKKTSMFYPSEEGYLDFGQKLQKVIKQGEDLLNTEHTFKRKNGEIFSSEITTTFIKENSEIVKVISIVRDITERKQAEESLLKSNTLLSEAERMARVGSWQWDIISNEFIFSEQWQKNHGVTKSRLSMDDLMHIAYPDDTEAINKAFQDVLNGVKPKYDIEHRIIRQDNGEVRFVRAIGEVAERSELGEPLKMIGFAQDITERKLAEEELEKHREHLEEMVKERTKELEDKNKELDRAIKVFVGRELKIGDLEKRIRELGGKE